MVEEKKYLLLNWILLSGYGLINLFAFYSSAYSWPTQGSTLWFLLIIFCPAFLYHLFFIGYVAKNKKKPHWQKSYRFFTLLAGILLAGGLLQITQKISLARFKTAYSSLIIQIEQKMPSPCDAHYFEIPQVNTFNLKANQKILLKGKPSGALFYNAQRFVLKFRGGSVDNDNSTLFYDSQSKNWQFFHNDDKTAFREFTTSLNGLTRCSVF